MPITPVNASLTVTTAGTRVQVSSNTNIRPASVYFEALSSNTGFIYIGVSTVSSTVYISRLSAGQGVSISLGDSADARESLQLSNLYADSSVNGEKVLVTYMYRTGG